MDGIVIIDKPQGMTSHDVVSFLRRKTGVKRIGHSGTLDPMATGVLPVFIGKATRLIEYAVRQGDAEAKVYRCVMRLGIRTDTDDIWGTVLEGGGVAASENFCDADHHETEYRSAEYQGAEYRNVEYRGIKLPGPEEIERVLKGFEGHIRQKPPMYSAVKIDGRKLYEYARKGETVDEGLIKERDVYVKHITVMEVDEKQGEVFFDIHCSKGVYIRTICADAGRILGCGAVMSSLRRLKSDGFSIEAAIPLEDLRSEDNELPLLPMDTPILWMPRVELDSEYAKAFAQGQIIDLRQCLPEGVLHSLSEEALHDAVTILRVYGSKGFFGVGELLEGFCLKPKKIIIGTSQNISEHGGNKNGQ